MDRWIFAFVGLLGAYKLFVALKTGDAELGIERNKRPVLFWLMVAVGAALVSLFLYLAIAPSEE